MTSKNLGLYAFSKCPNTPGVGVTKAPFANFYVKDILDLSKVHTKILLFESYSYMTGATAADLRQHLLNINLRYHVC